MRLFTVKAQASAAQELIEAVRVKTTNRCETCRFWGSAPGPRARPTYRRCKKDKIDTSPLYLCEQYEKAN